MHVCHLSLPEAACEVGLGQRRLRTLCTDGRVRGAFKIGAVWVIPSPVIVTGYRLECKYRTHQNRGLIPVRDRPEV